MIAPEATKEGLVEEQAADADCRVILGRWWPEKLGKDRAKEEENLSPTSRAAERALLRGEYRIDGQGVLYRLEQQTDARPPWWRLVVPKALTRRGGVLDGEAKSRALIAPE